MQDETPIVGVDVADQTLLRPPVCVRDLDEFIGFLAQLEEVFGPIRRAPELTTGERFLL